MYVYINIITIITIIIIIIMITTTSTFIITITSQQPELPGSVETDQGTYPQRRQDEKETCENNNPF